jgi:hypothetical protein
MKYELEINGAELPMNVGQVEENVPFTVTVAAENDDAVDRKIAAATLVGQRRDAQPLSITIADTATSDIDDPDENMVTWPDTDDGSTGDYAPRGTAAKRTIQPTETGRVTFTASVAGKGEVYLYFLLRLVYGPTSIPIQTVHTARVKVV